MKIFFLAASTAALLTISAHADTGNFQIRNNSFKDLFNANDASGTVKPTPWAGSFWAYGSNGLADAEGTPKSPAQKFDEWTKQGQKATKWELENHSCKNVDAELKEGCKSWWGHCNAWAAAAISHEEPRAGKTVDGIEFRVADLKAYLTEIWMASGSLFAGDTNKSVKTGQWVCDPNHKTSKETDEYGTTNYEKFWDLSPRSFFLILTNYVGLRNSGIVIDRFTGDEVWNQPIVGYRLARLKPSDVGVDPSSKLHYVQLSMTIYWAHDGVEGDFLTAMPFDINNIDEKMGRDRGYGASYERRTLNFKLFFNSPVEVNDGMVVNAGKIVGEGIWEQQERCGNAAQLDQGHPDFAWRPTDLETYGDANPYIKSTKVMQLIEANGGSGGGGSGGGGSNEGDGQHTFKVAFSMDYLSGRTDLAARRYIKKVFRRAGIEVHVEREISRNGRRIFATITFPDGVSPDRIKSIMEESGAASIEIKPVT